MLYICALCRRFERRPLDKQVVCQNCFESVETYRLRQSLLNLRVRENDYHVASIYRYEGLLRDLILNAKLRQEWRSVEACQHLLVRDEGVRSYMAQVRGVIPAPSSVRSRFLCKFDLGYFLAQALSEGFRCPLYQLPRKFYWRLQKQSMIPREFRKKNGKVSPSTKWAEVINKPQSSLLLVDDIMTTGSTVASIIKAKNLTRVKILTFASAYTEE